MRESPSVILMEKMRKLGAEVAYSDSHIPVFPKMRGHRFDLTGVMLTPQSLADFDGILLATGHDKFDYHMIKESAKFIVDSRGRYAEQSKNITKA